MSYHNNIQFTELTLDDIIAHEDLYIDLLTGGAVSIIPNEYIPAYYKYADDELLKAKKLFRETFK